MFLTELIPVPEALDTIAKNQKIMGTEKVTLDKAHKRVLAQEIISYHSSPPFDKSAMDGYAVKAQDTFGVSPSKPSQLQIVDRIGAGESSKVNLESGQAIKIATGAPIPAGADAVLMEEYTYEDGNQLEIMAALTPGENVSYKGEDINQGDKIIGPLTILRPQELAIIASAGFNEVEVYQKPSIGVIITGNELVDPSPTLEGAQVINSNQYTVQALVESTNAEVEVSHCVDDEELMEKALLDALEKYDAVITTGGTAISKGDVVVDTVDKLGEVLVHGVAVRPGKPVGFGMINDKPVFMLSGYPVAAMVQFDIFVRPYLLHMQHIPYQHRLVNRIVSRKVPSNLGRTDYIRAFAGDEEVTAILSRGSGVIRSMVDSNSYIFIEENDEGLKEGDECKVILFDSFLFYNP
jgi:molybdopterin molybdotransferase